MSVDKILEILRSGDTEFYSHLADSGLGGQIKITSRLAVNRVLGVVAEVLKIYPTTEIQEALDKYLNPETTTKRARE